MSDRILSSISEDFKRRMRNWARARAGLLSAMGLAYTSIYEGPIRVDRNPEASLPILEGEARDTDAMLKQLPARYRQAVELFWNKEGESLRRLAKECPKVDLTELVVTEEDLTVMARHTGKFGVDHHTFEAWVIKGHELLRPLIEAHNREYRRIAAANALIAAQIA